MFFRKRNIMTRQDVEAWLEEIGQADVAVKIGDDNKAESYLSDILLKLASYLVSKTKNSGIESDMSEMAKKLSKQTGVDIDICVKTIKKFCDYDKSLDFLNNCKSIL
jgi:hypothetical protein